MTMLTYEDLVTIRSVLIERREEIAETLSRVEKMIDEQTYKPLTTLNAKTIAALKEPAAGVAHSVEELIEALQANE